MGGRFAVLGVADKFAQVLVWFLMLHTVAFLGELGWGPSLLCWDLQAEVHRCARCSSCCTNTCLLSQC